MWHVKKKDFFNNFFRNTRRRERGFERSVVRSRLFFFFHAQPFPNISGALTCNGRPCRITRPRAWRACIILACAWIMNYGRSCPKMTYIRSGLRERASTSVALAPGSFMSPRGEGNGGPVEKKKKKGFVGHRLPLHAKIPALIRITLWESREKETEIRFVRASKISMLISRVSYALLILVISEYTKRALSVLVIFRQIPLI